MITIQKNQFFCPEMESVRCREGVEMTEVQGFSPCAFSKPVLLKNDKGDFRIKGPSDLFHRVAKAVAAAEPKDRETWARAFYEAMMARDFPAQQPDLTGPAATCA